MELARQQLEEAEHRLETAEEQRENIRETRRDLRSTIHKDVFTRELVKHAEDAAADPRYQSLLEDMNTADWVEDEFVSLLEDHGLEPLEQKAGIAIKYGVESVPGDQYSHDSAEWELLRDLRKKQEEIRDVKEEKFDRLYPDYELEATKVDMTRYNAVWDLAYWLTSFLAVDDSEEPPDVLTLRRDPGEDFSLEVEGGLEENPLGEEIHDLMENDRIAAVQVGQYMIPRQSLEEEATHREERYPSVVDGENGEEIGRWIVEIFENTAREQGMYDDVRTDIIPVYRQSEPDKDAELVLTVNKGSSLGEVHIPGTGKYWENGSAFLDSETYQEDDWFEQAEGHILPSDALPV